MLIIGITGSSGSGKSSVCKFIKNMRKAEIIDADRVVKELQDNKTEYYEKIVEIFGKQILLDDSFINRKKLAEIIFTNNLEKEKLDKLTSHYVVEEISKRIENLKANNLDYIIIDAPTLIESGMVDIFDKIIVVTAKVENKVNRICARDNISSENAKKRLMAQKDDDFYIKYADFVISNDDDNIEEKVKKLMTKIER